MNLLDKAYDILKEKIVESSCYNDYIYRIMNDEVIGKKFDEVTSYEKDGKVLSFASSAVKNVDFINEFSKMYGLDKEFCSIILKAFDSNTITEKIINTKFIETLYGNPNKEDLTNIDALFTIYESVFGLNCLTLFILDDKALDDRFRSVFNTFDKSLEYNFLNIINKVYEETKDLKNYDDIKDVFANYADDIMPFALPGLIKQIDEQANKNCNFSNTDNLRDRVVQLIGLNVKKKM